MTVILEASDLTKSYGDTHALAGVSLQVHAGEALAIMGASGSGKSTLLHVLAGILTPDSGWVGLHRDADAAGAAATVSIGELNDAARSQLRRETFGFVFQQGLLVPELTAVENVALPLMLGGLDRAQAEQRAAQWLAALGLAGFEQRRIGQLSGGQAQRVAVARAQVIEPLVVFADAPTGALDSATSAEVMDALIGATTGRGRTLVVVTHDEGVAARCSRVVRLRDGRVVETRSKVAGMDYIETPAGHQAAPTGTHEAAPTGTHEAAPTGAHQVAPTGAHQVAPTGTHQVAPTGTHQVAPTGTYGTEAQR
jgi:putative ABC transport system ATP-binding protein